MAEKMNPSKTYTVPKTTPPILVDPSTEHAIPKTTLPDMGEPEPGNAPLPPPTDNLPPPEELTFSQRVELAARKIAAQLGFDALAWGLKDIELTVVFRNGKKMVFDANPDPLTGKYIQLR